MRLFDSHAHLTDERLFHRLTEVLERAREAGVVGCVTVAGDLQDTEAARRIAQGDHPVRLWASAGIHPHVASTATPEALAAIEGHARAQEVVAVGETGLDYHTDDSPRDAQRAAFIAHLEIAERVGKPVVVHTRECDADAAAAIRERGSRVRGVLHCFTGGAELVRAALDAGWYVSFAGIVTFPRFAGADLLRAVPDDRILVETDSPYLAPVPHRGRVNEPAYVRHVVERAAAVRGVAPETLGERAFANALAFYGVAL
ncbi:MAG: TatD family hydrolase [Gemmatimonadetes bacterium]|nr:TatD family hydrolase [Gemmatimonadota bacterium]